MRFEGGFDSLFIIFFPGFGIEERNENVFVIFNNYFYIHIQISPDRLKEGLM